MTWSDGRQWTACDVGNHLNILTLLVIGTRCCVLQIGNLHRSYGDRLDRDIVNLSCMVVIRPSLTVSSSLEKIASFSNYVLVMFMNFGYPHDQCCSELESFCLSILNGLVFSSFIDWQFMAVWTRANLLCFIEVSHAR